jgi:hypothetical protein
MRASPRLLFAFAFAFASVASGCSVLDFEIERDVPEQRVSGSPLAGVLGTLFMDGGIPLEIDLASETGRRDTGPADAVRLTEMTLAITSTARPPGDSDDFDFVDRIEIFCESTMSGSRLSRVKIADLQPIPMGVTELDLDTDRSVDLKPYVEEGARITSTASGTVPPDDVTFDGHLVILVETL